MALRRPSLLRTLPVAFIAFCATVAVATILVSVNLGPETFPRLIEASSTEVALIFGPLCALTLVAVFEVLRLTIRGRLDFTPPAQPIRWKPDAEAS